MSSVSTWLPAKTHDRLIQIAQAEERSVSDIVRQVLIINIVNIFPSKADR